MVILNTQTKTTLLLLSAFLAIMLVFSSFLYFSITDYLQVDFYRLLRTRALATAKVALDNNIHTDRPGMDEMEEEFFDKLHNEHDYFFRVNEGSTFEQEAETINVPVSFFRKVLQEGEAEYNKMNKVFYKGIRYNNSEGVYIVIASAENYFEPRLTSYLQKMLLLATGMAFLLSVIISIYFSRNFFKPITKIRERVKQISSENLHLRLHIDHKNDELGELARTFNDMLNRIEMSFETQNNFISNASHELRTPLTAIIGEADVCLSKARRPEEYIETIKIILDEAEKLDSKTKALLFLAQTGFDGKIQKFEKVRVDQLLWDVKETIERINNKNKIFIDISLLPENPAKLKVKANEQLLHLALTNIISNACKYSDYQPVYISLGASDSQVFIVVRDTGIGIPESELKYIYDPFFRASNTKNYEGYGIGLPLTLNIIKMHQGKIRVSSMLNKGTTVQIELPVGNFDI